MSLSNLTNFLNEYASRQQLLLFAFDHLSESYQHLKADTHKRQLAAQIVRAVTQSGQTKLLLRFAQSLNPAAFAKYQPQIIIEEAPNQIGNNHPTPRNDVPPPPNTVQAGLPNTSFWVWILGIGAIIVVVGGVVALINDSLSIHNQLVMNTPPPSMQVTSTIEPIATAQPQPTNPIEAEKTEEAPTPQSNAWATCFQTHFADVQPQHHTQIETDLTHNLPLSSADQENQGGVGPFALKLTDLTKPIGAIKFLHFPANGSFKIVSIYDVGCQQVDHYMNDTRNVDKNSLQNWDVLKFYFTDGIYGIRFGDQGLRLRFSMKKLSDDE